MTTTLYPGAIRGIHWYGDTYEGDLMDPNVLALHTTEGTGVVSYSNGAEAPNLTFQPNFKTRKFDAYQHFALNRSARALVNKPGGVETNTLNVIQVELVGTCDPAHKTSWGKLRAGVDYIFWPDAPEWAYDALAELIAWMHTNMGIPLTGPSEWPAYPSSYGPTSARMTFAEWLGFKGICGHLHAPENVHGDPGDIPFAKIIAKAKAIVAKGSGTPAGSGSSGGTTTTKPKPAPPFPGASYFGPGENNAHVTALGKQLVKKGYGRFYTSGPGPRWTGADKNAVRAFQLAHASLKGAADGIPGPKTWALLFS
ncbi:MULTISPECIES: peptidoglycan-binding protein [unclassified Streptomyces]|uniref:peptidoglycan-binding protein n=1 Tax=unclassified Streptomyces TaxID=2593676 RepID=UPI00331A122D